MFLKNLGDGADCIVIVMDIQGYVIMIVETRDKQIKLFGKLDILVSCYDCQEDISWRDL